MSFQQRATTKPRKITSCGVRDVLESLPNEEADALRAMLAEPIKVRPHTELVKDFDEEGYPLSDATIGKHRRLECSCRLLVRA